VAGSSTLGQRVSSSAWARHSEEPVNALSRAHPACRLTVIIRADVQAASLTGGNGLRETEERGAERADTLVVEDTGRCQGRSSAGDFDAETVAGEV
jgi:hypothetical protein